MTEKREKYLFDILMAIALIDEFTLNIPDFWEYEKDLKTHYR